MHRHFARGRGGRDRRAGRPRVSRRRARTTASDRCSGCQLQHLSYDAQLAAKRSIVGDALRRIGKLTVADPEVTGATEQWRYRSAIDLTVKRWTGIVERHRVPSRMTDRAAVFPLVECHIADVRLMDAVARAEGASRSAAGSCHPAHAAARPRRRPGMSSRSPPESPGGPRVQLRSALSGGHERGVLVAARGGRAARRGRAIHRVPRHGVRSGTIRRWTVRRGTGWSRDSATCAAAGVGPVRRHRRYGAPPGGARGAGGERGCRREGHCLGARPGRPDGIRFAGALHRRPGRRCVAEPSRTAGRHRRAAPGRVALGRRAATGGGSGRPGGLSLPRSGDPRPRSPPPGGQLSPALGARVRSVPADGAGGGRGHLEAAAA